MLTKKTLAGFVIVSLALLFGTMTFAKTPDGMTPAEETVCSSLSGAAKGLCNAYCEAMDCDSAQPKASQKACDQVLANFQKKTGGSLPPCVSTGLSMCIDDCSVAGQECKDGCNGDTNCIDECQNDNVACTCKCLSDQNDECSAQCENSDDPKSCVGDCVTQACEDTCKVIAPPDNQEQCVDNCVSSDRICAQKDPCEGVTCENGLQCVDGTCCNAVPGPLCSDPIPGGCNENNCSGQFACGLDDQADSCCGLVCEDN